MFRFKLLLSISLFLSLSVGMLAQKMPLPTFEQLLIASEENPTLITEARILASSLTLPWNIYLPEGIFIEALSVQNNKPVYSVITNLANPYNGGYVSFYEDVIATYDISKARINYGNDVIINPEIGYPDISENAGTLDVLFLLVIESSNKRVMTFSHQTGDLINLNYIPAQDTLGTVKQARLSPWGTITISDQTKDFVGEYDTLGNRIGIFAPAGGVNTAILDNVRGHNYRNNDGNLVVTVGSSGNQNSIPEFDRTGNYIGQFITTGSGGLNSPFDIIFRTSDVLVTGSSSNAVHRYDLNGTYLNNFITGQSFPQQLTEMSDGNIAVANFSTGGGIRVYDNSGTLVQNLTGVTGNRGVYQLGNGNFLTTNGSGVHEVNGTTGVLVRTIVSGVSGHYISPFDPSVIPVELTSFTSSVVDGLVQLNWQTATETNNAGFEIQRSSEKSNWTEIGFVTGNGTTAEIQNYSYTDQIPINAVNYYRLKQIDYDGSYEYSKVIEVDISTPQYFTLEQNYPNPFNPATIINYNLPANGFVTLKIYDLLGNLVTSLINEEQSAGRYSVSFDATGLASGFYFYTIKVNDFTDLKKMLYLK